LKKHRDKFFATIPAVRKDIGVNTGTPLFPSFTTVQQLPQEKYDTIWERLAIKACRCPKEQHNKSWERPVTVTSGRAFRKHEEQYKNWEMHVGSLKSEMIRIGK
jgi:hypothetical protein